MKLFPADLGSQLDFDHIRKDLAKLCSNPWGKNLSLGLSPLHNRKLLEETLAETDEVLALLLSDENFPSAEYEQLGEFLSKLRIRGNALTEEQFHAIRSTCDVYTYQFRFLEKQKLRLPSLWEKIQFHPVEKKVSEQISAVIDEHGHMRSNASPELARIRKELVKSRASADRVFARALKKFRDKGMLADFDESVSENRRVLAISSSYKGQVQGIFHGSSSKQSIVFIEPGETVEINNRIAELLDDEKQEIKRILRELTATLAPFYEYIKRCTELLNWLDFIRAKAIYAKREECCLPGISEKKEISLKKAYNPVLRYFNQQKERETVPLDLQLDAARRILVISGPNAGGKSLSLKTVGLLQIMLQSGLLVPVHRDSRMSYFSQLFGDIGDAQSIENELSTYSSKLHKMRHFLQDADDDTLLLIDEFGSGSDPELGSAMAQVFLQKLNCFKTFGIFTTHFNAIKAQAAQTEGVENGAMLFDRSTFEPRYLLQIGNPGSSFTFEVAQKSGIGKHLIEEARERVAQNVLEVDQLLVQIQDDKIALENIRKRQEDEVEKLKKLQAEQRDRIAKLEEKLSKQTKLNEEADRLMHFGQRFQKLLDSWMEQKTQKDKKAVVSRFIAMLNQRAGEVEKTEKTTHTKQSKAHLAKVEKYTAAEVKVGDDIRVLDSGITGTIIEKQGDKFKIALGGNLTALMERKKFVPVDAPIGQKPKKKKRKKSFSKPKGQSKQNSNESGEA